MKLVALLAGASLVLSATACGGTRGQAVPDVRGKNLPDAAVALYEAHLCVRAVPGRSLPWGTPSQPVVAQSPAPGAHEHAWSLVTLTVRFPEPPQGTAGRSTTSSFMWGGPKPPCPPITSGG
jgi:beta-lactam-binding protein with PASTA domain